MNTPLFIGVTGLVLALGAVAGCESSGGSGADAALGGAGGQVTGGAGGAGGQVIGGQVTGGTGGQVTGGTGGIGGAGGQVTGGSGGSGGTGGIGGQVTGGSGGIGGSGGTGGQVVGGSGGSGGSGGTGGQILPPDACAQPIEVGPCEAAIPRYAYDAAAGRCVFFVYGGCQGNDNNFDTMAACEARCPPESPCSALGDIAPCNADAACEWLAPACADDSIPAAGCHDRMPCASDADCSAGDTCTVVSVNPCVDQPCDACAAPRSVCLPPPEPDRCAGAALDPAGQCVLADGVTIDALCCPPQGEEGLCVGSGGRWDFGACGHYQCGLPNACAALIPGCDCGAGATFVPGAGCQPDPSCPGGEGSFCDPFAPQCAPGLICVERAGEGVCLTPGCENDAACGPGERCCYPCGIQGCVNRCMPVEAGGECPLFP